MVPLLAWGRWVNNTGRNDESLLTPQNAQPYGEFLGKRYGKKASVFSGSCGHTYGNHSVRQMYAPVRRPVNGPLLYWYEAIYRPGGAQMQYLRRLIESRPYFSRVPDQTLVADTLDGADKIVATRGAGYAFV